MANASEWMYKKGQEDLINELTVRNPNPDDKPYKPPKDLPKPGQKPWPGYPNPIPPGKDWIGDHGMRINDQYVVPSGYRGIREQVDILPDGKGGWGPQFRIENEDGPPTYRPLTKDELEQYKHEVDPMGDRAQVNYPPDRPGDLLIRQARELYGKKDGKYQNADKWIDTLKKARLMIEGT